MKPTVQKRGIYLAAIVCLGASTALWVWGTMDAREVAHAPRAAAPPKVTRLSAPPPLDDFRQLTNKPLRRPLVDPPPPPPPEKKKKRKNRASAPRRPSVNLQLVGTVLEVGHSVAILINPQGELTLGTEGQELRLPPAGVRVERVELDRVLLSFRGETITLEMPRLELE